MTITIEAFGRTFFLSMAEDKPREPEEIHPQGDVYAMTERRKSTDYEDKTPIGYITSKGRS